MIRIYGKFEDVGSEYDTQAPVMISLSPIDCETCMYLDLEEGQEYPSVEYESDDEPLEDWHIYNGEVNMGEYLYNPQTGEYINSRVVGGCIGGETFVELEDGRKIYEDGGYNYRDNCTFAGGYESEWFMFQRYEEGKPVGKPRFEVL